MTRLERNVNLTAVMLPPLGIAIAVPLLWGKLLGPSDVAIGIALYLLVGFGVTVGYHRLLTHRAFATHRWLERALAVAGGLSLSRAPGGWGGDAPQSHAHTGAE